VHLRFSRWAKSGVWVRLFRHLATDADNEYAMIDRGGSGNSDDLITGFSA